MLVLNREPNEELVIEVPGYDPIVITILRRKGERTQVGIDADAAIGVYRREVYEAIQKHERRPKHQLRDHVRGVRERMGQNTEPVHESHPADA